ARRVTTAPAVPADPDPHGPTARGASRTIAAQVGARLVSLIAVVGSMAIVGRTLGDVGYAGWGTVTQLVGLMAFAVDPGVSPIVVRRLLHEPRTAPSPAALVPVRLGLATIALAIVVAITVGLNGTGATLLAVVLGAQVVPRALVLNATPWLQIDQRLHRQTALEAVAAILGLALLGLCALLDASAPLLALAGFTGPTTLLAILMRRELRITPARRLDVPGPQRERVVSLLREVAPLAGALVLVSAYVRSYVVFLDAAEDEGTVGRYLFAFQFVDQFLVVAGIVAGAVLPLLAVRAREAALLRDDRTHDLLVAVTAVGALLAAAVVVFAHLAIAIVGGPAFDGADRFLQLLAPTAPLLLCSFVLSYVYVTVGRSGAYLGYNAVGLLVNLAAHAVFTLHFGAEAAARVTWGTEATVILLALWPVTKVPSGRRAVAAFVAVVAAAVVAGELAAADVLPPLLAGALATLVVLVVARRPLLWLLASVGVPVHRLPFVAAP
ncbi:lipopolysaccharide biosynthesis protein, partial [Patulibacter sp. S7RM1-6]